MQKDLIKCLTLGYDEVEAVNLFYTDQITLCTPHSDIHDWSQCLLEGNSAKDHEHYTISC
jgi:hypothetical protein